MSHAYRPLRADDEREFGRFQDILMQAFNIPIEHFVRLRRDFPERLMDARVLEEDGDILSVCFIHDMTSYVGSSEVKMGGIGAVACPPEFRRRKATARLLAAALEEMRQSGHHLSTLYPFKYEFYRKYGWELAGMRQRFVIKTEQLGKFLPAKGTARRIHLTEDVMGSSDYEDIDRVYKRFVSFRVGALVRNKRHWEKQILTAEGTRWYGYLWYPDGEITPQGYVIYTLVKHDEGQRARIREVAYTSVEAYRGLLGILANLDSQAAEITVDLPYDDMLTFLLDNPRVDVKLIPTYMLRLVNVESALRVRPFGLGEVEFNLFVTDTNCTWNDCQYSVQIADGKADVSCRGMGGSRVPGIHLDVKTLAQIYSGVLRPSQARQLGKLEVENASSKFLPALDQLFGNLTPYLNDYF